MDYIRQYRTEFSVVCCLSFFHFFVIVTVSDLSRTVVNCGLPNVCSIQKD